MNTFEILNKKFVEKHFIHLAKKIGWRASQPTSSTGPAPLNPASLWIEDPSLTGWLQQHNFQIILSTLCVHTVILVLSRHYGDSIKGPRKALEHHRNNVPTGLKGRIIESPVQNYHFTLFFKSSNVLID